MTARLELELFTKFRFTTGAHRAPLQASPGEEMIKGMLLETSNFAVLGIGFLLGLQHATDPDHIVAVSTFVGNERRLRRACGIGLFWGLGHTIALTAAGLIVLGLRIPISEWVAERLELVVATMLIVLGAKLMARVHTRWHDHHHDFKWSRLGFRTLLIGVVHGTAGSAALTLMVISTISSPVDGILYILVFGIGSMLGMLTISILLSIPLQVAGRQHGSIRPLQMGIGALSCAFGIYLAASIWINLS